MMEVNLEHMDFVHRDFVTRNSEKINQFLDRTDAGVKLIGMVLLNTIKNILSVVETIVNFLKSHVTFKKGFL